MEETRDLAERIVAHDLLGPEALFADEIGDEPIAPQGYELIRRLGRGGGGVVYLARDLELDREVAIKFLTDAGPGDLERFRREARYTARLRSAAIVQVYGIGEVEGQPYIAMQYLDGGNLATGRLALGDIVTVIAGIARALEHAHAQGIVHRDIKPENILLDREGRGYLADFGIATDLRGSLGETISRAGQIMGTPGLMPPEQARGDLLAIDGRSDVYAIGATLYRAVTGRAPFEAGSIVELLHAVIHDSPPLPRTFDPSIPRSLEAIIVKCMEKCRDHRFQTMAEVADELDRFLAGAPVDSAPTAWFQTLVKHRHGTTPAPRADDRATDLYWTVGTEVVRDIAAWDADLYRVTGSLAASFRRLDALLERLEAIVAARPDLAWPRFHRGVVLFRRGRLDEAREEMERVIDRMADLSGAYFELGRLYLALYIKEHHVARKHLSQVGVDEDLAAARPRLGQAVIAFREAQRLRGERLPWHGEYARAVSRFADRDFSGCVETCDRILDGEPDLEEVWKLRGDALDRSGADPVGSYERALRVRRSYFEALFAMAEAQLKRGERSAAKTALIRACEIHPEYADAMALLGRIWLEEARSAPRAAAAGHALDQALEHAQRAAAVDEGSYEARVALAEISIERGRANIAGAWLEPALDALRSASALPGCQNRVAMLTARAHLEYARELAARAEVTKAIAELDLTAALCETGGALVSDNAPWEALRRAVEEMRATLRD